MKMRRTLVLGVLGAVVALGGAAGAYLCSGRSPVTSFDGQQELAGAIETTDAQAPGLSLTGLNAEAVRPSGRMEGDLLVRFRAAGATHTRDCATAETRVHLLKGEHNVQLHGSWAEGEPGPCGPVVGHPPRCKLSDVWSKAKAKGAPDVPVADINLNTELGTGAAWRWRFETVDHPDGGSPVVTFHAEFDDDC